MCTLPTKSRRRFFIMETKLSTFQKIRLGGIQKMKTWKLVSGILSIVLFVFVSFQSCAAGIGNALAQNEEISGTGGMIVAVMLLVGGIVSVATRNANGKGGDIALVILYGIGLLVGFSTAGSFSDLNVWAFWCLICAILAIVSMIRKKKR